MLERIRPLPSPTKQVVDRLTDRIYESAENWLMAQVGTDRLPLTRRLRIIYHSLRGNLNTRIIRPNDILVLDPFKFELIRGALITRAYGLLGIKYRRFCNVRSERGGNLVLEWV